MMSYISWVRPFLSNRQNKMEIINEVTVLLASYHLFCFTEWIFDQLRRWEIGWSLVLLIGFNVTINITLLIYVAMKKAIQKVKTKLAKRRQKKKEKIRAKELRRRLKSISLD